MDEMLNPKQDVALEVILSRSRGSVVKVVTVYGDRVQEDTYSKGEDEEIRCETFHTDRMTIMCGFYNPLLPTHVNEMRTKDAQSGKVRDITAYTKEFERNNLALQSALADAMEKAEQLQMDKEDLQNHIEELEYKLRPPLTPEQEEALQAAAALTSKAIRETLNSDGILRKMMPPRDAPDSEAMG